MFRDAAVCKSRSICVYLIYFRSLLAGNFLWSLFPYLFYSFPSFLSCLCVRSFFPCPLR